MKTKLLMLAVAIALLAVSVTPVSAAFGVDVSGSAVQLIAPASAGPNDLVSNNYQVWYEGQATLTEDLAVDHLGQAGTFPGNDADLQSLGVGGTLTAGTKANVYVAHLDQPSDPCKPLCCYPTKSYGNTPDLKATLTFADKIIGMSLFTTSLDASDKYGPETIYDTGNGWRGLGGGDAFTVSADGKTLELDWAALKDDYDQIRIFTAGGGFGTPVPEPGSLVILGSCLTALPFLKRRK